MNTKVTSDLKTPTCPAEITSGAVEDLPEKGAGPASSNNLGWSILHMAVHFGTAETITALIIAGADLEARDGGGGTPLHRAVRYGTAETVTVLLNAGADPEARNEAGLTPLKLAKIARAKPEVIEALTT